MSLQASDRRGFTTSQSTWPSCWYRLTEAVTAQDGKVLRDVGPADLEQIGELAGTAWCVAQVMHEARGA